MIPTEEGYYPSSLVADERPLLRACSMILLFGFAKRIFCGLFILSAIQSPFNTRSDTHLLGQPTLMRIPDGFLSTEDANLNPVMQTLREECPHNLQENFAYIFHYHTVSVVTITESLSACFFSNKEDWSPE